MSRTVSAYIIAPVVPSNVKEREIKSLLTYKHLSFFSFQSNYIRVQISYLTKFNFSDNKLKSFYLHILLLSFYIIEALTTTIQIKFNEFSSLTCRIFITLEFIIFCAFKDHKSLHKCNLFSIFVTLFNRTDDVMQISCVIHVCTF